MQIGFMKLVLLVFS